MSASKTPESDKLMLHDDAYQAIMEFLEWVTERGYQLVALTDDAPIVKPQYLIGEFLGIDFTIVEAERKVAVDAIARYDATSKLYGVQFNNHVRGFDVSGGVFDKDGVLVAKHTSTDPGWLRRDLESKVSGMGSLFVWLGVDDRFGQESPKQVQMSDEREPVHSADVVLAGHEPCLATEGSTVCVRQKGHPSVHFGYIDEALGAGGPRAVWADSGTVDDSEVLLCFDAFEGHLCEEVVNHDGPHSCGAYSGACKQTWIG